MCVPAAPRVTSSLAAIKWQDIEAREVYNLHRALTGLYSLTTTWHGLPIKLLEPSLETGTCKQEQQTRNSGLLKRPGRVEFDHKGYFLHVLCADSKWVSFRAIVVPGKKPMSPQDFYNGYMSKRSVIEWTFT
jgi:methionyl-tRNA formyltransferase